MKQIIFGWLLFGLSTLMQAQVNNEALQKMADEDQAARQVVNIDWPSLNKADSLRREQVMVLMKEGKVVTGKDYLNAGIVFQHGNDTIASALAVSSFKIALELDSTLNRWWYPAAVDRDLMRRQLPQIYGTQFIKNASTEGKWKRYTIDTTKVTDEERRYYGVETLAEQVAKECMMNQQNIQTYYMATKSIDKTIAEIKRQFKEGALSAYAVSEDGINTFGYELLAQNKAQEAVRVFKLNIQLYPKAFNTYDSYGEILLQLGKKKQAYKAYRKSLVLNPDNENAQQILNKVQK